MQSLLDTRAHCFCRKWVYITKQSQLSHLGARVHISQYTKTQKPEARGCTKAPLIELRSPGAYLASSPGSDDALDFIKKTNAYSPLWRRNTYTHTTTRRRAPWDARGDDLASDRPAVRSLGSRARLPSFCSNFKGFRRQSFLPVAPLVVQPANSARRSRAFLMAVDDASFLFSFFHRYWTEWCQRSLKFM